MGSRQAVRQQDSAAVLPRAQARSKTLLETAIGHHHAGRLEKACETYRKVLRASPGDATTLYLMALATGELGYAERAIQLLVKAVDADPANAGFRDALVTALMNARRFAEAEVQLRQAVERDPNSPAAWMALGNVLKELGRFDEAVAAQRTAAELAPGAPEPLSNLGAVLKEAGKIEEAVGYFRAAAALAPDHPELRFNLGGALLAAGDPASAEAEFQHIVDANPAHARAWSHLGVAQREQGKLDEAVAALREAVRAAPDYADAHYNLGLALLMRGACAEGWREYDWREKLPGFSMRRVDLPRWDGGELAGRTLLVHCEQGLGDAIQFVRYVRALTGAGNAVVLECPPALVRLLEGADLGAQVVANGNPRPHCDAQVPMMSLPGLLDPELAAAGAMVPYLAAESGLVESWRDRLVDDGRFTVGIGWQGNPAYRADRMRSLPLSHFRPLAGVENVRLISLQKGEGRSQIAALDPAFPAEDWGVELDEMVVDGRKGAFVDTAAILQSLDLVIASDSALAHLAGALGIEVWMMLCRVPDWRWGLEGSSCPWYPTMRVFRQERAGDWDDLMARVGAELSQRAATKNRRT